ncbi:MAG: DUF6671 family protein [Oceanicaulis sp.]
MGEPAYTPFAGQVALIATMHGKQAALGPPLARLGFEVRTAEGLDTDAFGAFSGETERARTMLDAARAKARAAFAVSRDADWVFASEGAFGPHPALPVLPGYRELICALRPSDGLEVVETATGFETNFAHIDADSATDLDTFLGRIGFPDHAVIIKAGARVLAKAVTARTELDALIARHGAVRIETDMRAHLNPTRMAEIAKLADRLAGRLAATCPACSAPGWGRTGAEPGLRCEACGSPTALIAEEIWSCSACDHTERRERSDGLAAADPGDCPVCNP